MFSKAVPVVTKTGFCPFTFEGGTYALPSFVGGQFYLNIVAIMNSLQNTGVLMPLSFSVIWFTYMFSRSILIMQWFLKKHLLNNHDNLSIMTILIIVQPAIYSDSLFYYSTIVCYL